MEDNIEDKYLIISKTAIISMLYELSQQGEMFECNINNNNSFLTTILLIDKSKNKIFFETSRRDDDNKSLIKHNFCLLKAHPDGIQVRFKLDNVQYTKFADTIAFQASIPQELLRLQRRETFRVTEPIGKPTILTGYFSENKIDGIVKNISL